MDITIKREDIERLIERATKRQRSFQDTADRAANNENNETALWNWGAEYAMRRTLADLEILLEVADDIAHGIYSIAQ